MSNFLRQEGLLGRLRSVIFWATTVIIVIESLVGGVWDILRIDYIKEVLEQQLSYPTYLAIIIGVCKIPGAVVLLIPRFPRLKEWVYAGIFFIYTGAIVSHLAVGDIPGAIGPGGFTLLTMTSWALRPASRKDVTISLPGLTRGLVSATRSRAVGITYWATTGIITFVLLTGGFADLLRRPETAQGVMDLGFPLYFVSILGAWKLLGTMAILAPRFGRLKEWAYAGAFYNFAGAFTCHLIMGSTIDHVLWTGLFAVCTMVSWVLRPQERALPVAASPATTAA